MGTRGTLAVVAGTLWLALVFGALAASATSSNLISPLPGPWVGAGIASWFAVVAMIVGVVIRLDLPLPRIVIRLGMLALLAGSGWAMGTLGRSGYAWLAFSDGAAEKQSVSGMVVGMPRSGSTSVSVFSAELGRSFTLPFAGPAPSGFSCITLQVESTKAGVKRLVVPDGGIGTKDLHACPR